MLEAHVRITLKQPRNESLALVEDMCRLWGMRILKSGTDLHEAEIGMPVSVFKHMFKNPATKGKHEIPSVMDIFIEEAEVLRVKPLEGKSKKDKKD